MRVQPQKILIADSDATLRFVLSQTLSRLDYQVRATGNGATLLKWVMDGEGDVIIADALLPDVNLFDVLPRLFRQRPQLSVIVTSNATTLATTVSAIQAGAYEHLAKPFDMDELVAKVRSALARPTPVDAGRVRARALRDERLPLAGCSPSIQNVYRAVARLVDTNLTVMITGETGTGKLAVARALHELGRRRNGKFVTVKLGARPAEGLEAELFGDGEGRLGKLAGADGGTLFLDEVGEATPETQIRLLRLFDAGELPTDAASARAPDVRIVVATNRDLQALVCEGQFREDLYHRLNVAPLRLPALRERTEDIPHIVRAFLLRANGEGLPLKIIQPEALERLKAHLWPGNVRELENLVRRICALYAEETITVRMVANELGEREPPPLEEEEVTQTVSAIIANHLAPFFTERSDGELPDGFYKRVLDDAERPLIELTLAAAGGNQVRAAKMLGLNRGTLRRRIDDLGVDVAKAGASRTSLTPAHQL
jgi:two-component system nitrogen regulation response regulator GlnG